MRLASGGLFGGRRGAGPPEGYIITNLDTHDLESPLPSGPTTLVLEQATLAPGAVLPGPPGALRATASGPMVAYLPKASDGSVTNFAREPVVAYVLTFVPNGPESESPQATPAA